MTLLVILFASFFLFCLPAQAAGKDLTGKTIVITGASSGFGRGVALKLAAAGANVVLAARRANLLQKLATECGAALVVPADVSDEESVKYLRDQAVKRFGRIDVWINDAGVGTIGKFTDIPLADHRKTIETNLIGTVNGSYFAMLQFKQQHAGTLINVSSISGKVATAYYSSYSASKFAVRGLDRALRAELDAEGEHGIHICTVMPMPASTPFWQHAANYTGHKIKPYPVCTADKVVDAIVDLVYSPKDEVPVGTTTKVAFAALKLAPTLTEFKMAKIIRKHQIEAGIAAPSTDGILFKPMLAGAGVNADR